MTGPTLKEDFILHRVDTIRAAVSRLRRLADLGEAEFLSDPDNYAYCRTPPSTSFAGCAGHRKPHCSQVGPGASARLSRHFGAVGPTRHHPE